MWLVVLSLLSMVVCAGAFALLYLSSDSRVQVLAVARPVAAGQEIITTDLRVVRVVPDSGVELVPARQASQVVGRTAVVPLATGSLLTQGQLGPAAWPPVGQAVVAVPVKAGRLASGVTAGARVVVIPIASDEATTPTRSSDAKPPPLVGATVVQVIDGVDGAGTAVVSLLVDRDDVAAVGGAAGEVSIAVARQ